MTDDTLALLNLVHRYAELIDNGDLEGVAELFRHGCIRAPAHDGIAQGYDQVLAMYRRSTRIYPQTGTPCTQHVVGNPIIDWAVNADEPEMRSRFTVFQAAEDFPLQPIIAGRYHDRFQRLEGKWWFKERIMQVELVGDLRRHLLYDLDAAGPA